MHGTAADYSRRSGGQSGRRTDLLLEVFFAEGGRLLPAVPVEDREQPHAGSRAELLGDVLVLLAKRWERCEGSGFPGNEAAWQRWWGVTMLTRQPCIAEDPYWTCEKDPSSLSFDVMGLAR